MELAHAKPDLVEVPMGVPAVAVDAVAFHNLASVSAVELKQGNAMWEAVTGGCAPNTFMVRDTATGTPIFVMEEKSKCFMRCCCNGCQPLYVKFYNTAGPYPASRASPPLRRVIRAPLAPGLL